MCIAIATLVRLQRYSPHRPTRMPHPLRHRSHPQPPRKHPPHRSILRLEKEILGSGHSVEYGLLGGENGGGGGESDSVWSDDEEWGGV